MNDEQVTREDLNEVSVENGASTKGWQQVEMGELADYQNGNAFSKSEWTDEGYPIIRIQNLTGEQDDFNYFNGDLEDRYRVKNGDLLLSWSATIDVFEWNGPEAALNQHIYRVDTTDRVNEIFYRFKLEELLPRLEALSHGSTMKHVRKVDLVNLAADIPPPEEQRKIASVLYTVDQAIQLRENLIKRTRRLKEGLMRELFNEGYFEHQSYRQDGWRCLAKRIPSEWGMAPAEEYMTIRRGASPRPRSDDTLFGGEIPWIKIGDAPRNGQKSITSVESYVTEKGKPKSEFVEEGTLLVANSGATCGFAVFAGIDGCVHDGWLILEDYDGFEANFLYHYINWNFEYLQSLSLGSAQTNLSTYLFARLDIPQPSVEEQSKIADTLDHIEDQEAKFGSEIERLQHLKRGLMQDLLSGEVRTHDKDIEIVDEVLAHG